MSLEFQAPATDGFDEPATAPGEGRWRGRLVPTLSGHWYDPFNLLPTDLSPSDLVLTLANQCRYGGKVAWHYSVAQHSLLLAQALPPELEFAGLMHDAVEAWLPDQIAPLKREPCMAFWRDAEARGQAAVADRFGLARSFHESPALLAMHARLTATEMRRLCGQVMPGVAPLEIRIPRLTPVEAAAQFVDRFFALWRGP